MMNSVEDLASFVLGVPESHPGRFGGPLDETRVRAYWESQSPHYAPDGESGVIRVAHRRQLAAALRLARPIRGERVLDAGAGGGLLTRQLVELGCEVTAVDASPAMVEQLRRLTPDVRLAKLEDADLGDGVFDQVLAIGVLNFVTDPDGALRRLCRAVKPGGTLVLQVTEWSFFGCMYWLNYLVRGFRPFLLSRRWLTQRASELGFQPVGNEHPLPHDLTIAFKRERG
jgi:SAM-dependent methyltransferase